jgi:hypothetical protein
MSTFICASCGWLIDEGHPHYNDHGKRILCSDCALKKGYIGPMTWLNEHGIHVYDHAEYANGEITAFRKCGRGYGKDTIRVL